MQDLRKLERFDLKLPARMNVLNSDGQSFDLVTEKVYGGGVSSLVTVGGKVLRSQPDNMAIRFDKQYKIGPAA
jgi:hypothetical protein